MTHVFVLLSAQRGKKTHYNFSLIPLTTKTRAEDVQAVVSHATPESSCRVVNARWVETPRQWQGTYADNGDPFRTRGRERSLAWLKKAVGHS